MEIPKLASSLEQIEAFDDVPDDFVLPEGSVKKGEKSQTQLLLHCSGQ